MMSAGRISVRLGRASLVMLAPVGLWGQSKDAQRTIDLIASTLDQLGEKALATRLKADFKSGRVKFGKLYDYGVIQNLHDTAEVKAGAMGWGDATTNTMTINDRYESTALPAERPERKASSLLMLASTMVHEYVHMGQKHPDLKPEFEEPAYRAQEVAISNWINLLETESRKASGPDRSTRLGEIKGLLDHISGEIAGLKDATTRGVASGFIRKATTWNWDALSAKLKQVNQGITALKAGSGGTTAPSMATWSGVWITNFGPLTLTQRGSSVSGTYSHDGGSLTGTVNGSGLTGTWVERDDRGTFSFQISADGASFTGSWKETHPSPSQGGPWSGKRK